VNADMGLLTAITIAFALAADFLFLPPLLMKLDR
jgi:predicted RND superfamily exporter protein